VLANASEFNAAWVRIRALCSLEVFFELQKIAADLGRIRRVAVQSACPMTAISALPRR
jgi:hypothetical protein